MVDEPGGRKHHDGAIPLVGGLVIIPVFSALVYCAQLPSYLPLASLLGGVFLLLIIGVLDDKFHTHPWARFVLQIWLASFVVIFCDGAIRNLGDLYGFGDVYLGWFAKAFSVTCLVLLMNAINMLDGMDGLASGFISVALGWLIYAAWQAGLIISFWAMMFLLIPLLAFLVFNMRHPFRKKASIFLGDAGSLSLALVLGWFAIKMAQQDQSGDQAIPAVVIIWIMTVPIMDTFAIFFVRMRQGRSPFDADRLHIHHKLQDYGIKVQWATPLILLLAFVTGGIGYLGIQIGIPEYVLLYSWSAILLGYTAYRLHYAKENTPKTS
ncbi:MAG: MraY family glycosyltransferase [Alphaproteobacteria bacterium]|nr:MraY family glycosyltransferase [Alphaproteobacteria bacterium]